MICAASPARADDLASTADLDGTYLALGPALAAVRAEDGWDGAFGAELQLYRLRERALASVVGASAGAFKFSARDGGHAWGNLILGSRRPLGIPLGVSAGVTAELDPVAPPRWGAHGSVWLYAGVIPYLRAGAVEGSGAFVDVGIRIALPAARW